MWCYVQELDIYGKWDRSRRAPCRTLKVGLIVIMMKTTSLLSRLDIWPCTSCHPNLECPSGSIPFFITLKAVSKSTIQSHVCIPPNAFEFIEFQFSCLVLYSSHNRINSIPILSQKRHAMPGIKNQHLNTSNQHTPTSPNEMQFPHRQPSTQ